jgi:hypothetical protein
MDAKLGPSYDFKQLFKGPIATFIHNGRKITRLEIHLY